LKMFIQGESADAASAETFGVSNPATGEIVDSVPKGGREDARRAIDAASDAFKVWSEKPPIERSRVLLKIAEHVRADVDDLAMTLTLEQGKPLG